MHPMFATHAAGIDIDAYWFGLHAPLVIAVTNVVEHHTDLAQARE